MKFLIISVLFSDEPRIPLAEGDVVRVTRWKKHWLYGDKLIPSSPPGKEEKEKEEEEQGGNSMEILNFGRFFGPSFG